MNRVFFALIALVLALAASGCVQATIETNLAADGSGSLSMVYGMSAKTVEIMKELDALGGSQDLGNEMSMLLADVDRAKLDAACAKHGVKVKKFEQTAPGGGTKVEMAFDFKSMEGLNAALHEGMDGMDDGSFMVFKRADGNYVLRTAPKSSDAQDEDEETEEKAAEEFDPEKAGKLMEVMGKLMASVSELAVTTRITVPGDVIEHNAPKLEGRTAIWEINAENMMTAGASMGSPEIVFSGKGLKFDAPAEAEE